MDRGGRADRRRGAGAVPLHRVLGHHRCPGAGGDRAHLGEHVEPARRVRGPCLSGTAGVRGAWRLLRADPCPARHLAVRRTAGRGRRLWRGGAAALVAGVPAAQRVLRDCHVGARRDHHAHHREVLLDRWRHRHAAARPGRVRPGAADRLHLLGRAGRHGAGDARYLPAAAEQARPGAHRHPRRRGGRQQLGSTGRPGEDARVRGGGRGLRRRGRIARDQPAPGAAGRGVQRAVDRGNGVRDHYRGAGHDRGADHRYRGVYGAAANAVVLQRLVPDHPRPGGDRRGPVRAAWPLGAGGHPSERAAVPGRVLGAAGPRATAWPANAPAAALSPRRPHRPAPGKIRACRCAYLYAWPAAACSPRRYVEMFGLHKTRMITADQALPGRSAAMRVPARHEVLDAPLAPPYPPGTEITEFALGCFWGAERTFWQVPGVVTTAVGYEGGFTPNPTYEEVCSGRTGHAETVRVVFDPAKVTYRDLLKVFWESHDPTQGMRQGNDLGTQYRSAIFYHSDEQRAAAEESKVAFQKKLSEAGYPEITTEITPAPEFYFAEDYHQQYLSGNKNPNGYCPDHGTGVSCPIGVVKADD